MSQLEFAQSQVEYYRRNLCCGHPRDWPIILGQYQYWQSVVRKLT